MDAKQLFQIYEPDALCRALVTLKVGLGVGGVLAGEVAGEHLVRLLVPLQMPVPVVLLLRQGHSTNWTLGWIATGHLIDMMCVLHR